VSQVKVRAYICIDEHGNYQIIGGSSITDLNKNQATAIIEEGIKVSGVNSTTTSFQVNIDLPAQSPKEEEKNEVTNVSE